MRHPVDPTMLSGSAGDAACAEPATTAGPGRSRFLRNNPDFLLVQPDLLHDLAAPLRWTGDKIVDFQRLHGRDAARRAGRASATAPRR